MERNGTKSRLDRRCIAVIAIASAAVIVPAVTAGPVNVGGSAVDAIRQCVGFGMTEDDLVTRRGGKVPDLIPFGSDNSGFGVKASGQYFEVAYFSFQSKSDNDWTYYLTGYTGDENIDCAKTVTGMICEHVQEKLSDWATYTVHVVEEGNLSMLRLPPQIDPVADCPLPE